MCRDEGVDFAQGFLIGKPVPYDEFVAAFLPAAHRGGAERLNGAGRAAPARQQEKETREPCSGFNGWSDWRSSARRRWARGALWVAVAAGDPEAGQRPQRGLLFGIWRVFYDTEMPSPRVLLAAVGVALLLAAGVAGARAPAGHPRPPQRGPATGCRWRPSW